MPREESTTNTLSRFLNDFFRRNDNDQLENVAALSPDGIV
jgi:hypothetical protein